MATGLRVKFEPVLHVAPLAVAFTISLERHTLWPIRSNIEMDVLRLVLA